ncbi:MAG: Uma2 family endonuclease [Candidatus Hydrogenedentes bacterium]|nr:Uma2 family endonuclease [Candidatus Hydrogenedentota bacterium]
MTTDVIPNLVPAPRRQPPGKLATAEAFIEWLDDTTRAEWVKGEVTILSPVSKPHQEMVLFLGTLIKHFAEYHDLGLVMIAPFPVKLPRSISVREPDVLFLTSEHVGQALQTAVDGPVDLAIEIISPDSRARDHGEKYYEYEQDGVREYWLIDPQRKKAEFFRLGADGTYDPVVPSSDGIFRSDVLDGFWLNVNWLWQEPLPQVLDILREWKLV